MAHRVPLHGGKCRTLHGHRYAVEITVAGELAREGYVLDFADIKAKVGGWIDEHLDHTAAYQKDDPLMIEFARLNARAGLKPFFAMDSAPTAETIAELIGRQAERLLDGFRVCQVKVWETPNCSATWTP